MVIDALAMPWVNARGDSSLIGMQNDGCESGWWHCRGVYPDGYDQVMFTQDVETIEAFSSWVVLVKVGRAYTGEHINIMVQALWTEDGFLPQGLTVQNTYKELRWGSKKAVMVVRNIMAYLQTLWKKTPVARAVAMHPGAWTTQWGSVAGGGDEPQNPDTPKLTVRQRHGKLFDKLDLNGLNSWLPGLADATCQFLAEYHNVFSLDPAELGCIHSTKHKIKVTDDTPIEEWFRQITLPLVEEVQNHLQEMLQSGTIRPSQSTWCNAVVLVRKKDGSLQFCITFCHLNTRMKKNSYPLPRIQEALESLVGAGHFSCLDLKLGFW